MGKLYRAKDHLGNDFITEKTLEKKGFVSVERVESLETDLSEHKQEYNTHKDNSDIHTDTDEKNNWSNKYTKEEVDEKLVNKAEKTGLESLQETVTTHIAENDTHTTKSEKDGWADKYTKEETNQKLGEKVNNTEFETLSQKVDTINQSLESHTSDDSLHLKPEKVEEWNEIATVKNSVNLLQTKSLTEASTFKNTPAVNLTWGDKLKATCNWFQIHARYLKPGKIKKITISGETDSQYSSNTAYLTLYSSTDCNTWTKLGTSSESTTITAEKAGEFTFASEIELKQDSHVRFVFSSSADNVSENDSSVLMSTSGMKCASDDPISKICGSTIESSYLVHIAIEYDESTSESVKQHLENTSGHWVGMEKSNFLNFMQGYDGKTSVKDILERLKKLEESLGGE